MIDSPTYEELFDAYEKTIELASDYREDRDKAIGLLDELEPFVQEYFLNNPDKKELLENLKKLR